MSTARVRTLCAHNTLAGVGEHNRADTALVAMSGGGCPVISGTGW